MTAKQWISRCNGRWIDLTGLTVCAAITVVLYLGAVRPMMQARAQAASARTRLLQLERTLERGRRRLQVLQRRIDRREITLRSVEHLNQRLKRLTELARREGLRIHRIMPGEKIPGEHYITIPIRISGRGTYPAAVAFLRRLHHTLADMGVQSLELRAERRSGGVKRKLNRDAVEATFEFRLLWYAVEE